MTERYIVVVWKLEGVGIEKFIGPFEDRDEALNHAETFRMANIAPLTAPVER